MITWYQAPRVAEYWTDRHCEEENGEPIIDVPVDIKNTVKTLHLSSTLIKNIARTSHILLVIILNTVKTSIRIIIIINIPDQPSGEASNNHYIKMIIIITKNNHKYSRSAFWRSTRESLLKNVAKRGISYFLWCRFILVKVKAMMEMFFEFLVCFISWSFFAYPWWCHSKFFLSRNVSMTKISIEGARMGLGQDGLNVGWRDLHLCEMPIITKI